MLLKGNMMAGSFGEVEHFATMVAGCESINNGNFKTPDGVYASAVLRLYSDSFSSVAGQESMLDKLKAGAKNVKEWIIKLIKAIRDWLKGDTVKDVEKEAEAVKKTEEFIEKAINQPELMNDAKQAPASTTSDSKQSQDKPKAQASTQSTSKLSYSPNKSKEENTQVMGERYKVVLSEIKAAGAESLISAIELLEFVGRMDTDNVLREQFKYILELAKPIGSLKNAQDNLKKEQSRGIGNISYDISAVIKNLLGIFASLNSHIEGYAKKSNLDPEYDKKYFPLAAKLMQHFGKAVNTLIMVHTKLANEFFKKTGIRQTKF